MNRIFFYLLLFVSILLGSCFTYIEEELNIKPKLVLHCYLIPQKDTTILSLTNSSPLFGRNPIKSAPVINATVEISDDNHRWVQMRYYPGYGVYFIPQAQFPIKEGKTYYIRASAPEYETVSSSCTVPYYREVNFEFVVEEHTRCTHGGEPYSEPHKHRYLRWTDYKGEENYYMFYENYDWWSWSWEWDSDTGESYYTDSVLHNAWGLLWADHNKRCIFSDHGQDGQKMSALLQVHWFGTRYDDLSEITLLQTDKHAYLYQSSIWDYNGDMAFFMLEPTKIYSNIKNGYGVFGAFTMRTYAVENYNVQYFK